MSLLSVKNLSYSAHKTQLLFDISLSAAAGKITALLGPNGAGKTTLLKTVMGLYQTPAIIPPDRNYILFNDKIINGWPPHQRVAAGLSFLPQQTSLFQQMSVLDNLYLVYYYQEYWQGKPKADFDVEMNDWLCKIGLDDRRQQYAATLSGGQKRKLEVARCLLMHPLMLILDEPFAGVDPKSIYELKTLFETVAHQGLGIIISDHHVDQLFAMADHLYVVMAGRTVTSGAIHDILNDEETKTMYLGNDFYDEMVFKFKHRHDKNEKEGRL